MARDIGERTNTLIWVILALAVLALMVALVALNQPARVVPAEARVQDLQLQVMSLIKQIKINLSG
jgi:hypothetical protein